MSVDTRCHLPASVDAVMSAKAIGRMLGMPPTRKDGELWFKGLQLLHAGVCPGMQRIHIVLEGQNIGCFFHEQMSGAAGGGISGKSNIMWIATGRKLVEYFGGAMHYTDTDRGKPDYQSKGILDLAILQDVDEKRAIKNMDEAIMGLTPLMPEELEELAGDCGYVDEEFKQQIQALLKRNKAISEKLNLQKLVSATRKTKMSRAFKI